MNLKIMKSQFAKHHFSKKKAIIFSASFIVFAFLTGLFIFEVTKKTVTLQLDETKKVVKTHADTVGELLTDLQVSYNQHDYVSPSLDSKLEDETEIIWKPAKKVILTVDGEKEEYWTTEKTVSSFLKAENINVNEHDLLSVSMDEKISNNFNVKLDKAFEFILNDGGKEKKYWTTSITVADFLKQHDIALNDLDRIEPGLDEILHHGTNIDIIRVEKVTDVVEEAIDYAVVTKKDHNLTSGKRKVIQNGKEGKLQKKYEVTMENGKEVARELVSEKVIEKATDKIVAVGTKPVVTVSRGKETGKEFYVSATAYTANCNGCNGRTATGINLKANPNIKIIAVDPSVIPLGTKVYVEGYGYATAADTGGSIKGYKIDVYFPTKQQAYSWGQRRVKIKILK